MPLLNNPNLPPPQNPIEFERMANEAARIRWGRTSFAQYGRPGQVQHGVDIYAQSGQMTGIAIQCKNSCKAIPISLIKNEINNAENFAHTITELYIATTQLTDGRLQDEVWKISASRRAEGKFSVSMLFWEDIVGDLSKEQQTLFTFYPYLKSLLHDQEVMNELKTLLPYNGSMAFIRQHGFLTPPYFNDKDKLDDVYKFDERCSDPSFKFLDEVLESYRLTLQDNLNKFLRLIGQHYTRRAGTELIELHPYKNESYMREIVSMLEEAANNAYSNFASLVSPTKF